MKHVLIAGTGRSGTTFLVALLTHLGMDTGFTTDDLLVLNTYVRAGLEHDARQVGLPYIVKSPFICSYIDELLQHKAGDIARVIVPIRDVTAAAESRRAVQDKVVEHYQYDVTTGVNGGLWPGVAPQDQEATLLEMHYRLVLGCAKWAIPMTHVHYPRLIKDPQYLHERLEAILIGCSRQRFDRSFWATVKPEWVHQLAENDVWET